MDTSVRAAIVGTGSFLPERVLTNLDLERMVDTSDEWIVTRTGIRERRVAHEGMATSDMAAEASRRAFEDAGIGPDDVDLIIIATVTPDTMLPSTACHLQREINALNAACFDISVACSGFVYGVILAHQHLALHPSETVLVVGAETLTRFTDYTDRRSCILFGDGAGAAVLQAADDGRGILATEWGADGRGADMMITYGGGSRLPASHQTVDERKHFMTIRGREVFRFAVLKMTELVDAALRQCRLTIDDVALIVPHQVNTRILVSSADRLGIPMDKIYVNIDRCANTSAASVPIALDEARREGRITRGDLVVLVAFGGGLSWSSAVIRW